MKTESIKLIDNYLQDIPDEKLSEIINFLNLLDSSDLDLIEKKEVSEALSQTEGINWRKLRENV